MVRADLSYKLSETIFIVLKLFHHNVYEMSVPSRVKTRPGSEADIDSTNSTTLEPEVSSVRASVPTSSPQPRLFVNNETVTSSTSINITGLEHFTEYMIKVSATYRLVLPLLM